MDVRFIDTTFRDGSQSLWASGMRTGMIEAVAEDMDHAGFDAIEVPVNGIYMKKFVRDLKEDPWEMARMVAQKDAQHGQELHGRRPPHSRSKRRRRGRSSSSFTTRLVATGALNRAQMTSNTLRPDQAHLSLDHPDVQEAGAADRLALSYTISPRHTDEYYAQKTRELLAVQAGRDLSQGPGRAADRRPRAHPASGDRRRMPAACPSSCTPIARPGWPLWSIWRRCSWGCATLHTAVPPLANGSSQPSVLNVARNARLMGYRPTIDEDDAALGRGAADGDRQAGEAADRRAAGIRLRAIHPSGARRRHLEPQHQLAELRIQHRLDEVLEESVQVRKDLGYPIMITPHSQFVVTQAAINVATGERYKLVIDELILFAQGVYGEDSGYTWMDQNLKDRLLGMPQGQGARQLRGKTGRHARTRSAAKLGGPGVSDEEFCCATS